MLEKFKEENKRKKQILAFTIICIFLIAGVFLYQSFALFEANENFNIFSGNTEDPGDITFTFYINDEIVLEAPKKDSGLALDEKSSCTNGVSVSWNVETWISNLDYSNYKQESTSKVKCNLYFHNAEFSDYVTSCGENGDKASDCMKKYAGLDTVNLAYDDTTDNNLRYIGANPNNYVWFNEELWRIIGVMNNVDDGTGNKEARIKLIRDESIGEYSWDSSPSNINNGWGINEWSQSKLKTLLNDFYYNQKESQMCYVSLENSLELCSFKENGIKDETKKYIDEIIWHTGSNGPNIYYKIITKEFYALERSENSGKICIQGTKTCNDNLLRTIIWAGKIGLIYPSDYSYATSTGAKITREACLNTSMYEWFDEDKRECLENNWIYKSNFYQWTITPLAVSNPSEATDVYRISNQKDIGNHATFYAYAIFPTLYLNQNITIVSGLGTREYPYLLFLKKEKKF